MYFLNLEIDMYSFNLEIDRCIHFRDGYLVWEGLGRKIDWKKRTEEYK
jgi:hypothetical protein